LSRKIAIVGKGGTYALAPWHDLDWEIWGMPWIIFPRCTRLFELHTQEVCEACEESQRDAEWVHKSIAKYGDTPVYCDPTRMHVFPNAIEYPLAEIKKSLPISYLENTIAYELAMALWEHDQGQTVAEIGLWGIHMMGRGEFVWQRPSVTYLIGLAQGRGIKVTIAPGSPLFMSGYIAGRYGVDMRERDPRVITGA
jgi:hypothetical protein